MYGRGGRKNIQCSWLIEGLEDETVIVTVKAIKQKHNDCRSIRHQTNSLDCQGGNDPFLKLEISDVPWDNIEVPIACLCSEDNLPYTIKSRGSSILLNMTILGMNPEDDFNNFNFDVEYEFLKMKKCHGGNRKLSAPAGGVLLSYEEDPEECNSRPWLLEAAPGFSFLLTLPRATLANESCSTDSRLVLRVPGAKDPLIVVCPAADHDATIQFVWPPIPGLQNSSNYAPYMSDIYKEVPQLVAQWEPRMASPLTMHWLHLQNPARFYPLKVFVV